jgi:predicted aspartyl protease
MKIGETRVAVRLYGPKGAESLEKLVDTGSTLSKIPESVANRIGVSINEIATVELADGSLRERGEGYADVELQGKKRLVPILVGPDWEEPLLGLTTLEIFKLKVNSAAQKLEPAKWIE